MLPALLEALIPVFVSWAISLLGPGNSPSKDSIVTLVKDVAALLDKFVPKWLQPEEAVLESLIVAAIEKLFPNL